MGQCNTVQIDRPRVPRDEHQGSWSWLERTVEFRLRKIIGRFAQYQIGLPKLPHFAFQFLDPIPLSTGGTVACPAVTLAKRPLRESLAKAAFQRVGSSQSFRLQLTRA